MSTKHHDFAWIQTQLILTRWYLDAAASAAAEAVHHHLEQAHRMYEITVRSLTHLRLDEHERSFVERELAVLRVRFDMETPELLIGGEG